MVLTRQRRGNWNRDYRTATQGIIPEERRRLLVDRGILPEESNENEPTGIIGVDYVFDSQPRISFNSNDIPGGRRAMPLEALSTGRRGTAWSDFVSQWGSMTSGGNYTFTVSQQPSFKYIESHDYKPNKFNFNKIYDSKDDKPYLGVELEIDKAGKIDDNAKLVIDTLGDNNAYCVHDGSLEDGFEIVTHPSTLDYHMNLDYDILFKKLVKLGYKSHDTKTCGLHVHFNKNFFGESKTIQDLCITKLLYLFEKYWDNIAKFCRRDGNKYASRYGMKEDESMFDVLYKAKMATESYNGRYRSINLKNKDTVEIRVFKGTLKYNTFVATLQFVNRLVIMCRDFGLEEIQSLRWEDIIKDIDKELEQYLGERKLIEQKLKTQMA